MMEIKSPIQRESLPVETQANFYIGHKFEKLSSVPAQKYSANINVDLCLEPVIEAAQFGVVVKTRLGPFRMYLGAEVDALSAPFPERFSQMMHLDYFVEMKTHCCEDKNAFCPDLLGWKGLRLWAQSFLIGIPQIYMGLRRINGELLDAKILPLTAFLPQNTITSTHRKYSWQRDEMLAFSVRFLKNVSSFVQKKPNTVWNIKLDPSEGLVFQPSVLPSFLPRFWIQRFENKHS
jgi:RAT1-interacting protein